MRSVLMVFLYYYLQLSLFEGMCKATCLERLPVPLEKHLTLEVRPLDVDSLAQIRSMFCLIKSSPNLHTLDIFVSEA